MTTFNLGSLGSTPVTKNGSPLNGNNLTDVYKFTSSGGNINLSLTNITGNDDADLALFRDSNKNGVLDASDRQVKLSSTSHVPSVIDDAINFRSSSGTFFC